MVMGEEAKFFEIDEHKRWKYLAKVTKKIPNNHRRGGQSQARIGRLRDEHIHRYVSMIEEKVRACYTVDGVTTIKRLVLSGPGIKKEQVRDRLNWLHAPMTLLTEQSFEGVVENFDTILGSDQRSDAKECIAEIEELLRVDSDRMVFGMDIRKAYENNQLCKIWTNDASHWTENNKTEIVEFDHYYLEGFGGSIGLRWYM